MTEKYNSNALKLEFKYEIPDVVWGKIPITEIEYKVIHSEDFARLMDVKQMGVLNVTFPGAFHHRYEHSIGVMHVADKLLGKIILVNDKASSYGTLGEYKKITRDVRQVLRLAALLHDIGHPPLSHVIEEALRKYPELLPEVSDRHDLLSEMVFKHPYSHEDATQFHIMQGRTESFLKEFEAPISNKEFGALAVGKATEEPFNLLNGIISGDLDADKIDYLKRDGHYCGFLSTFELSDFDNAILLESKAGTSTTYVSPSAVGTVNTFLHARYREIDEVHQEAKARIAVQVVIKAFQVAMQTMSADAREQQLSDLHLKYRDSDFTKLFDVAKKNSAKSIQTVDLWQQRFVKVTKGDVPYKEIYATFAGGENHSLDFEDFVPLQRLCLHTILSCPESIVYAENVLKQDLKDDQILLDIRTAKPPKFSIRVRKDRDKSWPLFAISETGKGILKDSIKNLRMFFYVPIEGSRNYEILFSDIQKIVVDAAKWATAKEFARTKSTFAHHILLVVIQEVLDHAVNELGMNSPWTYSQSYLQRFVVEVYEEIGIDCPYKISGDEVPSPDFVKDLEVLSTMGVIREVQVIVNVPNLRSPGEFSIVPRRDYQVTVHGSEYIKHIINPVTELEPVLIRVRRAVWSRQRTNASGLSKFAASEVDTESLRFDESLSRKLSQGRTRIRKEIGRKACLVVENVYSRKEKVNSEL